MINNEITAKEVRLIEESGNKVIPTSQALAKAKEEGLDLICISENGDIPVVKIADYKKYLYDRKKAEKASKKNSAVTEVKEIRLTESIEINDLRTKAKQIDKFLTNKNRVKLTIRYRGRSVAHINEGSKRLQNLTDLLTIPFNVETPSKIIGNCVTMTIIAK